MDKCEKLLAKARSSPTNLRFTELCRLAECYGFVFTRRQGSHCIYKHPAYRRFMDFQDNDGKAVRYQIEQLLTAIDEGAAATEEDGANG